MATDTPPGTWVWTTPFPTLEPGQPVEDDRPADPGARADRLQHEPADLLLLGRRLRHPHRAGDPRPRPQHHRPAPTPICSTRSASACSPSSARWSNSALGNKVTTFTASDFSRTFPTNSQGSDHGWGSHHMVMGGAVKGGADLRQPADLRDQRPRRHRHRALDSDPRRRSALRHARQVVWRESRQRHGDDLPESQPLLHLGSRLHDVARLRRPVGDRSPV